MKEFFVLDGLERSFQLHLHKKALCPARSNSSSSFEMSTIASDLLSSLLLFAFIASICVLYLIAQFIVNYLYELSFPAAKVPRVHIVEAPRNIQKESLLIRFQDDLISVRRPKAYDDIVKLLREATYVPTYKRIRVSTTLPNTTEEILVSPSVWELICPECKEIKVSIEVDNEHSVALGSPHRVEHGAFQAPATYAVPLAPLSTIASEDAPSDILGDCTAITTNDTPLYIHGHFDFRFRSYPLQTIRTLKLRFGAQYGLDNGSFDLYDGDKKLNDDDTVGGANLARNATLRIQRHRYTLTEEEQQEEEDYERLVAQTESVGIESVKSE
ncbi:hypothetical protein BDN72DRAFT_958967 [Pluteus cervinus]|uniref:Uncharacterized protein n=1 Tax=Pluteus cervinus TaxID=181527 RepID=A0ACD3AWV6_9AGAR|nr:hypothetical protein BDN72DRAFT_958967 [Pluteus cervinus]